MQRFGFYAKNSSYGEFGIVCSGHSDSYGKNDNHRLGL